MFDEEELKPEIKEEVSVQEEKKDDYVMKLPKEEIPEENIEPNKPAHWMLRISAGLIDLCILFLSIIGLRALIVSSPMGTHQRNVYNRIIEIQDNYKLEPLVKGSDETYGYISYEGEEDYDSSKHHVYHDDELDINYVILDHDKLSDEIKTAYADALSADKEYQNKTFDYRLIDFGFVCLSGFIVEGVFLFAIPLFNKNRATLGKMAAGLQVINSKYQVRARWYQMMGRWLFTLIIEGILPYLFLSGSLTAVIMPVFLFIISLCNKERKTLHDFVSRTRVIEKRTFLPLEEQ